jgi:hypothetical protein
MWLGIWTVTTAMAIGLAVIAVSMQPMERHAKSSARKSW